MATLESLKLSGWKSIRAIDPPLTFGRLNVLVGANGAGKSNLLSFFRFLDRVFNGSMHEEVARAGGAESLLHRGLKHTKQIAIELTWIAENSALQYQCELLPRSSSGLFLFREKVDDRRPSQVINQEPAAVAVSNAISGCQLYHFHDTTGTAAIRQSVYIDDNQRLRSDGGNLAAILHLYKQTRPVVYRRILSAIYQVAPFVDDFVVDPLRLNPKLVQLDWRATGSDYLLGPHQLSDGTLRMIALATLLLQPETDLPPFLVLDEPELGLHPAALGVLAGLLKHSAAHTQVLVATQSATLLNHFGPEDVIVVDSRDGESSFRRLDPEPYRAWLDEFGLADLWERNIIGGGPYR